MKFVFSHTFIQLTFFRFSFCLVFFVCMKNFEDSLWMNYRFSVGKCASTKNIHRYLDLKLLFIFFALLCLERCEFSIWIACQTLNLSKMKYLFVWLRISMSHTYINSADEIRMKEKSKQLLLFFINIRERSDIVKWKKKKTKKRCRNCCALLQEL